MTKAFKATNVVLLLLCVMYFITYIDRVNVGTAAAAFQGELKLDNTQLGLIFSAFAYPYLVFQIFGGWLGDRFGPRRTLCVCGAIWAVATMLTSLADGFVSLFAIRVLLGFGEGAIFPTATRAFQDWLPKEKRGFAQGLTHACARLGGATTPTAVAWLMAAVTWRLLRGAWIGEPYVGCRLDGLLPRRSTISTSNNRLYSPLAFSSQVSSVIH